MTASESDVAPSGPQQLVRARYQHGSPWPPLLLALAFLSETGDAVLLPGTVSGREGDGATDPTFLGHALQGGIF